VVKPSSEVEVLDASQSAEVLEMQGDISGISGMDIAVVSIVLGSDIAAGVS
jgi:hypothetical protein